MCRWWPAVLSLLTFNFNLVTFLDDFCDSAGFSEIKFQLVSSDSRDFSCGNYGNNDSMKCFERADFANKYSLQLSFLRKFL